MGKTVPDYISIGLKKELLQQLDLGNIEQFELALSKLELLKEQITFDKKLSEAVCKGLTHHDAWIRERTSLALAEIANKYCFKYLVESLQDKNSSIRDSACEALGSIGDKRAVKYLKKMIYDRDEQVRFSAIAALSNLNACSLLTLIKLLNDKSFLVRLSVTEALYKKCEKGENIKKISRLVRSYLPQERNGSVKCDLYEIQYAIEKNEEFLKKIIDLLKSRHIGVRYRVYATLDRIRNCSNAAFILKKVYEQKKYEKDKAHSETINKLIKIIGLR